MLITKLSISSADSPSSSLLLPFVPREKKRFFKRAIFILSSETLGSFFFYFRLLKVTLP